MTKRRIFCSRSLIAAAIAGTLFGNLPKAAAQTMDDLKMCQNLKADYEAVVEACSVFIDTRRRVGGRQSLPNDGLAVMFSLRGYARAHQGKDELAMSDFARAIRLNGKNISGVYFARGEVRWARLREMDNAISDLDEAIRLGPKQSGAFFERSMMHLYKGDEERAAADQKRAVELAPDKREQLTTNIDFARRWVRYLKEIQEDGDYANWTGPPLDNLRGSAVANADLSKDAATAKDSSPAKDASTSDSCALAATHWQSTESIATRAAYEDHLARFPNCTFAGLAKARLAALEKSEPEPAPSRHSAPRAARRVAPRSAGAAPAVDDPVANVVRSIPDASVRNMINGVLRQNGLQ